MCGISGIISLQSHKIEGLNKKLEVMNQLLAHRGPDGQGIWTNTSKTIGLAHRRLSIIDLNESADQPMIAENGMTIVYNGEIYNYLELQDALKSHWQFKTKSDTESVIAANQKYGKDCLNHLRGMFAFAIWDEKEQNLFCARDRFGIKPFYYTIQNDQFIFASEVKALLPFLKAIETDEEAFAEYITFQYTIGEKTLIKGVKQLLPGHALQIHNGDLKIWRYWDVQYNIDYAHTSSYFEHTLEELLADSLKVHLRSDVPIGSYVSGGIDSSLITLLANQETELDSLYHGKFTEFPGFDESPYANLVAQKINRPLHSSVIKAQDFYDNFKKIIYHLDFPVAGPGSFPQYMVSQLASQSVKVILGGQGGDELFGGYARYVLAYFEQSIKAAIDGTYKNGNFVVTPESIIPNLGVLKEYKPMIKEFWREGLFGSLDDRYFRLCDRSNDFHQEIDWLSLKKETVIENFKKIFNNNNVQKEAYFDKMTHFDFKCLLPALLHVEDRMSMAHGLEARVPLLDHPLVEFAATIPADIKFQGGKMKHLLKNTFKNVLPGEILNRRDKMGFPVPLKEWFDGELKGMVHEILNTEKARSRPFVNFSPNFYKELNSNNPFSRKLWALLSLEMWYQNVHDEHHRYVKMLSDEKNYVLI